MKSRPKLARVSEQTKEWSALLGEELCTWPKVTARGMFGMTAFYRKGTIFAALPRTKSFSTPDSIAFKLHRLDARLRKLLAADPRIAGPFREEGAWITLELSDASDLNVALKWLERAYESCLLPP